MSITTDSYSPPATATLTPVLSEQFALKWQHTLVCGWFAVLFMYLNYIPLFHTDLWCHVHYGKWILEHGRLPQHDPFLALGEGMRVVDTAWLAQVILAQVEAWGGPQFLSNLFAVVVFATYVIQTRVFYLLSGRMNVAVAGMMLSWFVAWSRHAIIRPEIFGGLCFALLLWSLVRVTPWRSRAAGFFTDAGGAGSGDPRTTGDTGERAGCPRALFFAIPLLFLFWANLHGSFAVGLVLLGCHALGRIIEVAWQQRNLRAVLADRWVRHWILLTQAALAATLINPYGLDLLIETARFGRNPNLRDVMEWFPLKLIDLEGIQFMAAMVLVMVLLRHSRQRMRPVDVLLLLVFAVAVAPTIRMIGWLGPVLAMVMVPHASDIWNRLWPAAGERNERESSDVDEPLTSSRFVYTLVCGLILWCGFALSPISQPLLSGKGREPSQIYSRDTPRGITEYLRENPPRKLVFGPQWWGDWLVWDGPPGMQVFMTTSVHLAPRQVWRDYMLAVRGESGWERVLDRYGADTLVIHTQLQPVLARAARRSSQWQTVYEDDHGVVLRRKGLTRDAAQPESDTIPFSEAPSP